jgi:hypothetical protein
MKKYKVQNRSQKNSHSCVPLINWLGCQSKHNYLCVDALNKIPDCEKFRCVSDPSVQMRGLHDRRVWGHPGAGGDEPRRGRDNPGRLLHRVRQCHACRD